MIIARQLSVFCFALSLGCVVCDRTNADEWVSLFNGKDLTGWKQINGTATYAVEDGAIVGTTAVGKANSFLCSEKNP